MSYVNISSIGTGHKEWLKGLQFYREEISGMEKRLEEVVAKYTSSDVNKEVEHFQNQFLLQTNNIRNLTHNIEAYVHALVKESEMHAGHVNKVMYTEHDLLEGEYLVLEKILNGLRHEFNNFLSKWL